jgi:phenylpropionate dioxygenase-like ring-hydroxylating dioxygenase large terminal subunit
MLDVLTTGIFRWFHPVLPAASLVDRPASIRLGGHRFVLWRDAEGVASGLLDRCAHRFSPLSAGRVRPDGRLACPYHGWNYDRRGEGRSPSLPTLANCRVPALTVVERYGYVWVAGPDVPVERMPALEWNTWQPAGHTRVPFAAPLHVALDNFSEDEHTPWVHGLLGWTEEQAAQLEFDHEDLEDSLRVQYRGPQRPNPWLPLLGVKPGDIFQNDWVTRYDPVWTCYTLRWFDARTGAPRPLAARFSIFMVPEDERTTVFHTFLHAQIAPGFYSWVAPLVKAVTLYLAHREIAFDGRFIRRSPTHRSNGAACASASSIAPSSHNHKLLEKIYWGTPQPSRAEARDLVREPPAECTAE